VSGREKKPNLVEMGPYVYKEKMEKKDVSFVDEETVRYSPVTTLIFDSNLSNGTLDQHVTFLNVPAWVRYYVKQNESNFSNIIFCLIMI